ncbi:RNA polymerase II subunit A C-terminal domain phosphatase isoform X2 [Drosophila willistoni]|uniref:RNA polymerase II subunit A C-terminal domain phosphatase isoform X2 n=1 Tax=Drosophila willistoni TaxID=7260 RepID=UPI000C26C73F|nr:RNA polymerase II subunit A C-terminal domain phosphatase isoform X2 [Drosophila willistoni]
MQQTSEKEEPPPAQGLSPTEESAVAGKEKGAEDGIVVALNTEMRTRRIRINKWRVHEGQNVAPAQILFLYQEVADDDDDADLDEDGNGKGKSADLQKYKSTRAGVVRKRLCKEHDVVLNGDALLELSECLHNTVMRDMCADCGADLRQNDNAQMSEASVPMVHTMPDLKVTQKLAQKLGHDDTRRLLNDRKLVLLVDLDQTIIHTTNDPVPENIKGIHHFQLYGSQSPWYHTCLRPGTTQFLERMSQMYELHICTFGARKYAHMIAQLIDPEGKLFSHRILSRDECFNATSKMDNLKALFPNGDKMVCIIDDREDVWNMATNLIQVKPYHFFQHTGDINAPPGLAKHELDGEGVKFTEDKQDQEQPKESKDKKTNSIQGTCDSESKELCDKSNVDSVPQEIKTETRNNDKKEEKKSNGQKQEQIVIEDPDDYLLYLEVILGNIYKRFYAIYDETGEIPDLKVLVPQLRSEVLRDQHLVFSGLVPMQMKLEQSRVYYLAKCLGAEVHSNIDKDVTTHLVAANVGTVKVNTAKMLSRIKVVNAYWLWACAERWEHVDEKLFPLDCKSYQVTAARGGPSPPVHQLEGGTPSSSKQQQQQQKKKVAEEEEEQSSKFRETINPLLLFTNADIESMNKEYNTFFDSDESSNSSLASSSTHED